MRHLQLFRLLAALTMVWLLASCEEDHKKRARMAALGSSSELRPSDAARPKPGSFGIKAMPGAGASERPIRLVLIPEQGARIYTSFLPFEDLDEATPLADPPILYPPFSLYAKSVKEQVAGPTHELNYPLFSTDAEDSPPAKSKPGHQLLGLQVAELDYSAPSPNQIKYFPTAKDAGSPVEVDGSSLDWDPELTPSISFDGRFDLPAELAAANIIWSGIREDDESFYFAIKTESNPRNSLLYAYGFHLGTAGVSPESFGEGANYFYTIQIDGNKVQLLQGKDRKKTKLDAPVVYGDILEFRVAKKDLPQLKGLANLIARAFAIDQSKLRVFRDQTLPITLRTKLSRSSFTSKTGRYRINFFESEKDHLRTDHSHLNLAEQALYGIAKINKVPFWGRGTVNLFYSNDSDVVFTGLNSIDRGILSTAGSHVPEIRRAQIVGHEIAHFTNSHDTAPSQRWIQEGMSEWTAQRWLHTIYPRKAVHELMRDLRIRPLLENADDRDLPALDDWDDQNNSFLYDRSYAFFCILDEKVGSDVLVKAFQIGQNTRLSSRSFQDLVEKLSGANLSKEFEEWVFNEIIDPSIITQPFSDSDEDGLTAFDEKILGTNPDSKDTDADGILDSEEYFLSLDPAEAIESEGVVLTNVSSAPGELLRLGGAKTMEYAAPGSTDKWQTYETPLHVRHPVSVQVKSENFPSPKTIDSKLLVYNSSEEPTEFTRSERQKKDSFQLDFSRSENQFAPITESSVITDVQGDLPLVMVSYDLRSISSQDKDEEVSIRLSTHGSPDKLGVNGVYKLVLMSLQEDETQVFKRQNYAQIIIDRGIARIANGIDMELNRKNVVVRFEEDSIVVRFPHEAAPGWLSADGIIRACTSTEVYHESGARYDDEEICTTLKAPSYERKTISVASPYLTTGHHIDLHYSATMDPAFVDKAAKILATSLRNTETLLQRPLWDRQIWPIFLHNKDQGSTYSGAHFGIYAALPNDLEELDALYYLAEELYRLYQDDIGERRGRFQPFWIRELSTAWLSMSSMFQIFAPQKVHQHLYEKRFRPFLCYYNADCPDFDPAPYPNEGARGLSSWVNYYDGTLREARTTMFAYLLDTRLGAEKVSKMLGMLENFTSDADSLLAYLKHDADDQQKEQINQIWTNWVKNSNPTVMQENATLFTIPDGETFSPIDQER